MTAFRKLMKLIKSLKNIRLRIQAASSKVNIRAFLLDRRRIKHILKVSNAVFWFELIKKCENYRLL